MSAFPRTAAALAAYDAHTADVTTEAEADAYFAADERLADEVVAAFAAETADRNRPDTVRAGLRGAGIAWLRGVVEAEATRPRPDGSRCGRDECSLCRGIPF